MKKLLFAVTAFMGLTVTAQETKFGAKAGLNYANIVGNTAGDFKSIVGFQVGGFAEIKLSDKFSVQPELLFSTQGTKFDYEIITLTQQFQQIISTETAYLNLSYLNIPIMAKYYVAEKISIQAGPQIGVLLTANGIADGNSDDLKSLFNTIDFGINIGAGFQFTEKLGVDLRYNAGLTKLNKEGNENIKNSVISLALFYKF